MLVVIGPIIGLAFVKFINLSGVEAGVMFIQASMPSAVLTFLVSEINSPKKTPYCNSRHVKFVSSSYGTKII